jgi:metal-responsive CopG/Arc/MetJ family transcriptional regulator
MADQGVKRALRGVARAASGELVKASVTLPRELLLDVDYAVLMRKRTDPAFNRSAMVEEALRAHVSVTSSGSDE